MATATPGRAPRRRSGTHTPRPGACGARGRSAPPSAARRAPAVVWVVSCDSPEERGQLADQAIAIEPFGDDGATGRAKALAERSVAIQAMQRIGDRSGLIGFDEKARF